LEQSEGLTDGLQDLADVRPKLTFSSIDSRLTWFEQGMISGLTFSSASLGRKRSPPTPKKTRNYLPH